MIAQIQSGQTFAEQNTVAPFVLKTDYDYAAFGSETLQQQAKQALSQFFGFVRQTFLSGLEIGRNLRQVLHQLCRERGLTQGDRLFDEWLDSSDFGGSTWMARALIQISQWFDRQKQRIQQLIHESVQSWSISALKELTKIDDHHLLVKLLKAGKQTVASIRKARKFITLGDSATKADWQLVAKTYGASSEDLATLQAEAARLAHQGESPSVLTNHLLEAVRHLTDWDAEKLLDPAKQPARRTKPNSAAPEDPLEPSQQLHAGVHHLPGEDGKDGKIIPQQHHLQKALRQQNLAPAVASQSDRVAELEKQVRDLSAQLKEADKAAALIRGLQAERDRLAKENLQLQQLLQEQAEKDCEIHQLHEQIANLEAAQSENAQVEEQNQQLKREFYALQQRYNELSFEMARNEQKMKYTDNTTLVAKVMVLEQQLEEANRALEEKTDPKEQPAPREKLVVGTYVRIGMHEQKQYRNCIGKIVAEPTKNDTLNRFKVLLSGKGQVITCYPEQLHLVDVFLPPEEYLSPGQVKKKLHTYTQQQRQQVAQLQAELRRAKAQIARYKDPANHPALLRQQEQIDTMQAKLYDSLKLLGHLKRENQQLKQQLESNTPPRRSKVVER